MMGMPFSCSRHKNELLVVCIGKLGDTLLSSSTFKSIKEHYNLPITVTGNALYLSLLPHFDEIVNLDDPDMMHVMNTPGLSKRWNNIVVINDDKREKTREYIQNFCANPVIFINQFPTTLTHIVNFQLNQLPEYGIVPIKEEPIPNISNRIIIYKDTSPGKTKSLPEFFDNLYLYLKSIIPNAILLEEDFMKSIYDIRDFLIEGGVFISDDSGMAHLASYCGLSTITLFHPQNINWPSVKWHPLGNNTVINTGEQHIMERIWDILQK